MGFDNVVAGNGFGIAIVGMLIVFTGLVLISLFIAAIPWTFERVRAAQIAREERQARAATATAPAATLAPVDDPELRAAIAYVLRLELEQDQALDTQQITMHRMESSRVWAYAGKMRTLSTRL